MPKDRGERIRSRLARLNIRLGQITQYQYAGTSMATDGAPATYPTYTQAKKALKAIPREIREGYERTIRKETTDQKNNVERQRVALRSTDIPSERQATKKSEREERKQKKART